MKGNETLWNMAIVLIIALTGVQLADELYHWVRPTRNFTEQTTLKELCK